MVESFRNWEKIKELDESVETGVVISDDGCPSSFRVILELNTIIEWGMAIDRADMRDDFRKAKREQCQCNDDSHSRNYN